MARCILRPEGRGDDASGCVLSHVCHEMSESKVTHLEMKDAGESQLY